MRSDCRGWAPEKIVLVGDPNRLSRVLESLAAEGYNTTIVVPREYSRLDCRAGTLVIAPPGSPVPAGECVSWIGVPHYQVIPDLVSRACLSGEWGDWISLYYSLVTELIGKLRWAPGDGIPSRPPPILVLAEAYYEGGVEGGLARLVRFKSEGADVPVLGFRGVGCGRGFLSAVEEAVDLLEVVGVDSWDTGLLVEALERGAWCGLSLTPDKLEVIPSRLREEKCFVIVPPLNARGVEERVSHLESAWRLARDMGFENIVLDPLLYPLVSPGALSGFIAARLLSERIVGAPLMLGLHNVYELADADTTGQILVLAGLAAEAGVSVFLVGEESVKSWGSVLEARLAADLVSIALHYGTPPKDYPLRLFLGKEKGR